MNDASREISGDGGSTPVPPTLSLHFERYLRSFKLRNFCHVDGSITCCPTGCSHGVHSVFRLDTHASDRVATIAMKFIAIVANSKAPENSWRCISPGSRVLHDTYLHRTYFRIFDVRREHSLLLGAYVASPITDTVDLVVIKQRPERSKPLYHAGRG